MKSLFKSEPLEISLSRYSKFGDNMPEHSHDYLTISLLLDGEVLEQVDGGSAVANGCQVSIKPPGLMHSDVFTKNSTILSLKVHDPKWFGIDLEEWKWVLPKDALAVFAALLGSDDKKEAIKSLSNYLEKGHLKEVVALPWLDAVHEVICENYRDHLSISALADMVDKHPVYLSRAFKRRYGTDIKSYQANLRLGYAIAERINHGASLTEIAHNTGFSDQSHFNRTFKSIFGNSPRQVLADFEV